MRVRVGLRLGVRKSGSVHVEVLRLEAVQVTDEARRG